MPEKRGRGGLLWVWALLLSVLLLTGLPVLGFNVSLRRLGNREERAVGHWRSLGMPPERPTAFVDADDRYVYLRGEGGSLLGCDCNGPTADNACWKRVEKTQESGAYVDRDVSYEGKRASPPGPVVESLDLTIYRHAETTVYVQYAVLEDGSVAVWQYTADANWNLGTLFLGPICGLASAIALVLGIWLALGVGALLRQRKRKREK
jgi:hypothetical protein